MDARERNRLHNVYREQAFARGIVSVSCQDRYAWARISGKSAEVAHHLASRAGQKQSVVPQDPYTWAGHSTFRSWAHRRDALARYGAEAGAIGLDADALNWYAVLRVADLEPQDALVWVPKLQARFGTFIR